MGKLISEYRRDAKVARAWRQFEQARATVQAERSYK